MQWKLRIKVIKFHKLIPVRVLSKQEREQELEARRTKFYSNQLMLPEFMSDVPSNFVGGWYAVPYPEGGVRCLVVSSMGKFPCCSNT